MTHIIVDEIHERDLFTDFLLIVLKNLTKVRKDIKVIYPGCCCAKLMLLLLFVLLLLLWSIEYVVAGCFNERDHGHPNVVGIL